MTSTNKEQLRGAIRDLQAAAFLDGQRALCRSLAETGNGITAAAPRQAGIARILQDVAASIAPEIERHAGRPTADIEKEILQLLSTPFSRLIHRLKERLACYRS